MLDADFLAQQAEALYSQNLGEQQEAADFYYSWISNPQSLYVAITILENYHDLYPIYASLHVCQSIAAHDWNKWNSSIKLKLRQILFFILNDRENRDPSIISSTAKLLAQIAINDFPEIWGDFIDEMIQISASFVLVEYFNILETNDNIPFFRKNQIREIFSHQLPLLVDVIFHQIDATPSSLELYNELCKWASPRQLITEQTLTILTKNYLNNEILFDETICILQTLFIDRYDTTDYFEQYFNILLPNLYHSSIDNSKSAQILSLILTKYIHQMCSYNIFLNHQQCFTLLVTYGWNNTSNEFWSTWKTFISNLKVEHINYLKTITQNLFKNMLDNATKSLDEIDSDNVINEDTIYCFSEICKIEEIQIINYMKSLEPSLNLCYALACSAGCLFNDFFIPFFIDLINVLKNDNEIIGNVLICVTNVLKHLGYNPDLVNMTLELFSVIFNMKNEFNFIAIMKSIRFLLLNNLENIIINSDEILNFLLNMIEEILINGNNEDFPMLFMQINALISEKSDKYLMDFVSKIMNLIWGNPNIDQVCSILNGMITFCEKCKPFSDVYFVTFFPFILNIITNENNNEKIMDVTYTFTASLLCNFSDWTKINDRFKEIISIQYTESDAHIESILRFLIDCARKRIETENYFIEIYHQYIERFMSDVNDFTELSLNYLSEIECWKQGYILHIKIYNDNITELTLPSIKYILKIIEKTFIFNTSDDSFRYYVENFEILFDFLFNVTTNSIYNRYFTQQVRTYMSLVNFSKLTIPNIENYKMKIMQILHHKISEIDKNEIISFVNHSFDVANDFESIKLSLRNVLICANCGVPNGYLFKETKEMDKICAMFDDADFSDFGGFEEVEVEFGNGTDLDFLD